MGTILIVHVPKAAGSTLRWIADRQYPQSEIFKIQNDIPEERERLASMADADKRLYRIVFGHMCWGWHECLADGQPFDYVTMLRDPVERVLSLYAYCKLPGHYLQKYATEMTLLQFMRSGVTRTCDNGMVRQLCGEDKFLRKPYFDMHLPFEGIGEEHLELAKRNLDRCAIVGLAERFEESMDMFRRKFRWRIPVIENKNVTTWPRPKRENLGSEGWRLMERYNGLDLKLYQYAQGLFERGQ